MKDFSIKGVLTFFMATGALLTAIGQDCENGFAGEYPCNRISQYAFLSADDIGGGVINDNWGWVSPETGREYVLQGRDSGTAFIDITDPSHPIYLGDLPTHDIAILWRDVKVYENYAFVVAESPNHGMQVFDLMQLDNVVDPPVVFEESAHYPMFGKAHNVFINEETGYAYAVGTSTFMSGLHIVDIRDPLNPELAGGFGEDGYTHDVQVVIYQGSDPDYIGREIAFASNENTLTIVDVTDKSDPILISRSSYELSSYAHQGWLTEDHSFFLMGDELDEGNFGNNTRTFVWQLDDLDEPELVGYHDSHLGSIDHNLYTLGNLIFQANYTAGLRVLQMNDLATLDIEEIAYFDIIPDNDAVQFKGAWNVYPYFPSGTLVVSNMYQGMHILQPNFNEFTGVNDLSVSDEFAVYPNPSTGEFVLSGMSSDIEAIEVFDLTGKAVLTIDIQSNITNDEVRLNLSNFPRGIYLARAGKQSVRLLVD